MRGIALGNRLEAPNEGDWGGTILASDFPFLAARGFDHVRIPIRFSGHALTTAPYTLDAAFMSRVDEVIGQALASDLAVLIDLQAYDDLAANVEGNRERYLALWAQLADHFQTLPETVAFELLNEPHGQLDTAWNDLLAAVVQVVRGVDHHADATEGRASVDHSAQRVHEQLLPKTTSLRAFVDSESSDRCHWQIVARQLARNDRRDLRRRHSRHRERVEAEHWGKPGIIAFAPPEDVGPGYIRDLVGDSVPLEIVIQGMLAAAKA